MIALLLVPVRARICLADCLQLCVSLPSLWIRSISVLELRFLAHDEERQRRKELDEKRRKHMRKTSAEVWCDAP